jgi:hypothetical protein
MYTQKRVTSMQELIGHEVSEGQIEHAAFGYLPERGFGVFKETYDVEANPPTATTLVAVEDQEELITQIANDFNSTEGHVDLAEDNNTIIASVTFYAAPVARESLKLVIQPPVITGTYEIAGPKLEASE